MSLGLSGCSEAPQGTVSGKVTYNGAALTAGEVNFYAPDKGSGSQASLDSSGAFKIDKIPVGSYKVFIQPPTPKQLPPGTAPEKIAFTLPPKFQDPVQTPVTKEVKAGPNDITIDLTD